MHSTSLVGFVSGGGSEFWTEETETVDEADDDDSDVVVDFLSLFEADATNVDDDGVMYEESSVAAAFEASCTAISAAAADVRNDATV